MTVYVDLLFSLNTAINYLLLRGAAAIGGVWRRPWRLLGAAGLGGLYAVAAVLPGAAFLSTIPAQLAVAAAMTALAFGLTPVTLRQGLYFLALSFALSGAVLLAVELLEPGLRLVGGRAYYAVSTPALLLLAALSYGLAALVLRGTGRHSGGSLVRLTLAWGGRDLALTALKDTGNHLRDPLTGEAVVIAPAWALSTLLGCAVERTAFDDPAALLERLSAAFPQARFRLIPYSAVGTAGLLLAMRCTVSGRPALVAFSPNDLSGGAYQALVGGDEG